MKIRTIFILLSLSIATIINHSSCKEDLCEAVICVNGDCNEGICDCIQGFGGADCSQMLTPTSFVIKSITYSNIPTTDASNDDAPWDDMVGNDFPDTRVAIYSGRSLVFLPGNIIFQGPANVDNEDTMYTEDLNAALPILNGDEFFINLLFHDKDSMDPVPSVDDDIIDYTTFNQGILVQPENPFPPILELEGLKEGGNMTFTVEIEYEF